MLDLNKMCKEERLEKGYYISFNEYVENCGYKYVYGAIAIKWKRCEEYFKKKGLTYEDYCDEIICGILKDWSKIDYERGTAKTFIGMNINKHHLHLMRYYDAEKRDINEDTILRLDEPTKTNGETNEATVADIIRCSDDVELQSSENNLMDNIIKLLKNDNQKISFELYLHGYNYKQIEKILNGRGIVRSHHSIRQDVSLAKKFLKSRYTPFTLLERI